MLFCDNLGYLLLTMVSVESFCSNYAKLIKSVQHSCGHSEFLKSIELKKGCVLLIVMCSALSELKCHYTGVGQHTQYIFIPDKTKKYN